MSKLFIPVGLPGAGKSTFIATFLTTESAWGRVVSTDDIRVELTGDINDMSQNEKVFEKFHQRIDEGLSFGVTVADATNLKDFARARLFQIANFANAETHAIVFTNIGQALTRNRARDRTVPAEVMEQFVDQYELALRDIPHEPFTSITYIKGLS